VTSILADLAKLIAASQPELVQIGAAKVLLEKNNAEVARLAFSRWTESSKNVRRQIIASSARPPRSALALLDAVEGGAIPMLEVDPATRQALEKSMSIEVKSRAAKLFAVAVSADRDAVVQKYRAALKLDGDRVRGAVLFEKTCAVCHQMQGVGAKVGPDLSGAGQHARETLLVDILDPSRQVLPDFVAYSATTKSGDSYTGFIANESATTVTLRRPNEPDITLPRADLREFKTGGKSLMPDGLEAGMSDQDMADLIEFLRRPDRTLFTQSK
jgi:putative heme-binding domain-containing protein